MTDRRARQETRNKILIAAATMLGEDPTARLSVRAVAARAGVSTGSLRHFFPTQRELIETVLAGIYDIEIPGDVIYDTTKTPHGRLLACLQQLLSQIGIGESARKHWRGLYETYVAAPPTEDESATYLALEQVGIHRIERWLTVLIDEGAIPEGDIEQRARFLHSVLNGLFMERALPTSPTRLGSETATLQLAVSTVTSYPPDAVVAAHE